jgi:Fur family ferric uptake transcriptional regulator
MHAQSAAGLAGAGERMTRPRAIVAAMVARREGPFTARDLLRQSGGRHRVGRATIFRTLELFDRLGFLERIDLPDGSHAYVRCRPAEHHHHVVCVQCGRAVEIPDSGLQRVTAEIARITGFILEEHRLELFGLCPACQRTGPTRALGRPTHADGSLRA